MLKPRFETKFSSLSVFGILVLDDPTFGGLGFPSAKPKVMQQGTLCGDYPKTLDTTTRSRGRSVVRHGLSVFHLWPSLGNGNRTTSVYHIPIWQHVMKSCTGSSVHYLSWTSHFQLELKTTNQKPRLKNVWKPFSFKTVFSSVIIISPGYLGNWHHRSSSGSGRGVQSFGIVPTEGMMHHLWSCTWKPKSPNVGSSKTKIPKTDKLENFVSNLGFNMSAWLWKLDF